MKISIKQQQLIDAGLNAELANSLLLKVETLLDHVDNPEHAWQILSKYSLTSEYAFQIHLLFFSTLFPHWNTQPETAPAWMPTQELMTSANLSVFMSKLDIQEVKSFHRWTVEHFQDFWQAIITQLNIKFDKSPDKICDDTRGVESITWLPGATLNIVNSCFTAAKQHLPSFMRHETKIFTLSLMMS